MEDVPFREIEREIEEIKPPVVGMAPLGALIWDAQEIPSGTVGIIDTFGYTYMTLFIEVDRPTRITLAEVSQDGAKWRRVEEIIKAFDRADRAFVNLNEVIETKEVLMYRFLKVRMDAEAPVTITLEVASKLIDMGVFQEIRDVFKIEERVIRERIEIIKETGVLEIDWSPILPVLEEVKEIHKILTNPEAWDHDQKNVTTPGTPVQLPGLVVPDGYALVIKAKRSNTGDIYTGNSKDTVKDATKRVTLAANDSIQLEVKKASAVWLDAVNANDGIEFWCEKRE